MKKVFTLFALAGLSAVLFAGLSAVLFTSCTHSLDPDTPIVPDQPQAYTHTYRPITILAAQEGDTAGAASDGSTKTTLGPSTQTLWSEGDSFSVLTGETTVESEEVVSDHLKVTVDSTSAGLGIYVGTAYSIAQVKYSYIKVTIDDNGYTSDVTKIITDTKASSSNIYNIGIYNSSKKYQYASAGNIVNAQINTSTASVEGTTNPAGVIPIIQTKGSSSFSSSYQAIVDLKGLMFSLDEGTTWTIVNSKTYPWESFRNGSTWSSKNDVEYEWVESSTPTTITIPGTNEQFTIAAEDAGRTSASFTGKLADEEQQPDYYALYPYNAAATLSDKTISFTLPSTQTYAQNSFGNGASPMAGKLTEEDGEYKVAFKNLCGVLQLQLTGNETVTGITLKDNGGNALWGDATVDMSADEPVASVTSSSSDASELTLVCPEPVQLDPTTPTSFYFVLPVGALSSGFTATVSTYYGDATLATSNSQSIVRSTIKSLPGCPLGEITMEEFNIENPAVSDYLANANITLSSTADSRYGQSYFDQSRSYRPDQPNVKEIYFTNTSGVTVMMSTDPSFSTTVLNKALVAGTESYTLRNFVPGNTYYYKVVEGMKILTAGAFKATGQVRMIAVEKGFNIRDLGGWTGLNGNKVRYEAVYRGASLGGTDMYGTTSDITQEDKDELYRIGMRAQLDLRAATNSGKYSGEYSYHSYSRGETTLKDADFNNTMTDYGAYNTDASVVSDIAWIIYELKRGKPVYFNCRQGADRTGTIAFIIEGLLGCYGNNTGKQMGMDYELTGFSQANLVDNKTVETSYRAATEAYGNTSKLFKALLNLSASGITFNNLQEKCYYYLNSYWASSSTVIDDDDLDWFIEYMLDMQSGTYSHPSFAVNRGDNLQTVAEKMANVVAYK